MQELRSQVHLPVQPCGALLVAWSEAELAKLPAIVQKAHDNGVTNVRRLTREELYGMEPSLASHALGAVHVPDEMLVDPLSLPLILLQHARLLGLRVYRSARVEDLELETLTWIWRVTLSGPGAAAAAKAKELEAYRGDGPRKVENATAVLHARYVVSLFLACSALLARVLNAASSAMCISQINCGGLHGDSIEKLKNRALAEVRFDPTECRAGLFVWLNRFGTHVLLAFVLRDPCFVCHRSTFRARWVLNSPSHRAKDSSRCTRLRTRPALLRAAMCHRSLPQVRECLFHRLCLLLALAGAASSLWLLPTQPVAVCCSSWRRR
jgi:hypothetical protein